MIQREYKNIFERTLREKSVNSRVSLGERFQFEFGSGISSF